MFVCIDQQQLYFIRTQQNKLQVTLLNGLEDVLSMNDNLIDLNQLGQHIILPSSYLGGPRDMHQRYLDRMAIAHHFKKIDIFLTMTANPGWPEIKRELYHGQTVIDFLDLVTCIFQLKRKALMSAILKDSIFSSCAAHVYAIKFQKWGLPHMHLLLFLKAEHKLLSPKIVDNIISTQWPDPITQPRLSEAVKRFMVHGPCGALDPHAPYMKDGKCIHRYPKLFQHHTTMDHEGYPHYKCSDNGRCYEV